MALFIDSQNILLNSDDTNTASFELKEKKLSLQNEVVSVAKELLDNNAKEKIIYWQENGNYLPFIVDDDDDTLKALTIIYKNEEFENLKLNITSMLQHPKEHLKKLLSTYNIHLSLTLLHENSWEDAIISLYINANKNLNVSFLRHSNNDTNPHILSLKSSFNGGEYWKVKTSTYSILCRIHCVGYSEFVHDFTSSIKEAKKILYYKPLSAHLFVDIPSEDIMDRFIDDLVFTANSTYQLDYIPDYKKKLMELKECIRVANYKISYHNMLLFYNHLKEELLNLQFDF